MKRTTRIFVEKEILSDEYSFDYPACILPPDFFVRANAQSNDPDSSKNSLPRTLLSVVHPDGRDVLRVEGK